MSSKNRQKIHLPRLQIFVLCVLLLSLLSILYSLLHLFVKRETFSKKTLVKNNLEYVVVHLDFKGMPPKLEYLESLLLPLRKHGVNGLLVEYEDTFPYDGKLGNLTVIYHYKKMELKKFLTAAVNQGFEIIPLIQTFGHMEFVLKMAEFKRLRENPLQKDSICPSRPESLELVREMLSQVIQFHNSIAPLKYIHIGCDEVYHMNECKFCKARKLSKIELYLDHVANVADIIKDLSPDTTVLIWNDMLLDTNRDFWNTKKHLSNIEVVYWHYRPEVSLSHAALYKQHKVFPNIWIASAFKGADGYSGILPNAYNRASNTLSWLQQIKDYRFGGEHTAYNFKGIFLTGWSKYNHFGPLCDLLVPSMPSLLIDLEIVNQFKEGVTLPGDLGGDNIKLVNRIKENLKPELSCDHNLTIYLDFSDCKFEGRNLYVALYEVMMLMRNMTEYNDELIAENKINKNWCNKINEKLSKFRRTVSTLLTPYYEKRLIYEYIHLKWLEAKQKLSVCFETKNRKMLKI